MGGALQLGEVSTGGVSVQGGGQLYTTGRLARCRQEAGRPVLALPRLKFASQDWTCDGHGDCTDGSDEMTCNVTCSEEEFQCLNSDCIQVGAGVDSGGVGGRGDFYPTLKKTF